MRQFNTELATIFSTFLTDNNNPNMNLLDAKSKLMLALDKLERKVRKEIKDRKKENGLWWRFFKNDTLANTAMRINNSLENPHSNNFKHCIECMKIAVETPEEISVYFS